jgi:predicted P-loop ATPase
MSNVISIRNQSWFNELQMSDGGKPICNVHNAIIAVENLFYGDFALDEMTQKIVMIKENNRQLNDNDITIIQAAIQKKAGMTRLGQDTTVQAISLKATEWSFHPVKDYLEKLVWDEKPRINVWTNKILGCEETEYNSAIGRMFLIAMIARIYEPGCKADHVPVLEGAQGLMKSTACSVLAGEWFSDSLPDIKQGKECSQHLRGKWIIEIAEMASFDKAESNLLKSFITRSTEMYRPPFGRVEVEEPRQCVFMGTTNKSSYLKDETGNRRFWPILCTKINIDALRKNRDQMLAEAVILYKEGIHWWPDKDFEATHIKPQQDQRYDADPWEEAIETYLTVQASTTINTVAVGALGLDVKKMGRMEQNRISRTMESLGWRKARKTNVGQLWERAESPTFI